MSFIRRLFFFGLRVFTIIIHDTPRIWRARIRRLIQRPTVLDMIDGVRRFDNKRWAIFLIWQPKATPWYVENALDALAEAQINVLLVVNHGLSNGRRKALASQCAEIMLRDNSGFDIGGYRDASLYLARSADVERVLYLNDSVYYFREGLADLFRRMISSKADACGAFENWQIRYHLQSFCFAVSGDMLRHPKFIKFWRNYLPVNSRRRAINKGEAGISRALVPIASFIEILYTPDSIKPRLEQLPKDELIRINHMLPIPLRIDHRRARKLSPSSLISEICDRLQAASQIHTGASIYRRFMRCPLMKRDLVWRRMFTISDIEEILRSSGDEGRAIDILSDMRRRGIGSLLPWGWQRLKYNAGLI